MTHIQSKAKAVKKDSFPYARLLGRESFQLRDDVGRVVRSLLQDLQEADVFDQDTIPLGGGLLHPLEPRLILERGEGKRGREGQTDREMERSRRKRGRRWKSTRR